MTSTTRTAERSPLRWPAAAIAVTIAAAHVPITAQHLSEAPYIGVSFVVLEVVAVVLAVGLVAWDSVAMWRTAVIVPTLALIAFVVARLVPLPQIADDLGNWTEPLSFVAMTAEALLLILAVIHITNPRQRSRLVARPVVLAVALLVIGLAAITVAASMSSG